MEENLKSHCLNNKTCKHRLDMKKSNSAWNSLEQFHKSISERSTQEIDGLTPFLEISKFAKELELNIPTSPTLYVRFITNMHYNWLKKASKFFKIVSTIPNYEIRIKRMFNTEDIFDSLAALYEIEMALKFKIQGFEVSFIEEKSTAKTPDMEVKLANRVFNLEVTTVNNPDEIQEKMKFYLLLNAIMFKHKVGMAGNLIHIPTQLQGELIQEIEEKAIESSEMGKKFKITRKGKFVLEIVPRTALKELTFQGVQFVHKELNDIEDKVNWIITNKQEQLDVNHNPGILCIYGGSRTINIEELYTKSYDKINPYLQTFPNLSALVLSSYTDFYPTESLNYLESQMNAKILRIIKPGFGENEQSIIWKNSAANFKIPYEFVKLYEDY